MGEPELATIPKRLDLVILQPCAVLGAGLPSWKGPGREN